MIEYTVKVYKNGTYWYLEGKLHREDGPAVEYSDGSKYWSIHGELHREDGPAMEYSNGFKAWLLGGKRHRTDGPAVEYSNGDKEWHLNGVHYTEEEFNKKMSAVKDMTAEEISKALGYNVRITK